MTIEEIQSRSWGLDCAADLRLCEAHKWKIDIDADRALCMTHGTWYCEPSNPWPGKRKHPGFTYHPSAREASDQKSEWLKVGIICRECPICGHSWIEMPR